MRRMLQEQMQDEKEEAEDGVCPQLVCMFVPAPVEDMLMSAERQLTVRRLNPAPPLRKLA